MGYITKSARVINKNLVEFFPELDSDYARYPMNHARWYEPMATGPKGEPCFLPFDGSNAVKQDYVFCKQGPNGAGYYSLMTHYAYVCLYKQIESVAPQSAACPCFNSKETRDAVDRHDDVKRVMFMRQLCVDKPDDKLADDIVMGNAKAVAKKVYNITQAEQLVFNAVNVATI